MLAVYGYQPSVASHHNHLREKFRLKLSNALFNGSSRDKGETAVYTTGSHRHETCVTPECLRSCSLKERRSLGEHHNMSTT